MPYHAGNHTENLRKVCIICLSKGYNKITDLVLERILKYIHGFEKYDPLDPRYPKAICSTCRKTLVDVSNGKISKSILPKAYNFETLIRTFDEGSTKCKCFICQVARQKVGSNKNLCNSPLSES